MIHFLFQNPHAYTFNTLLADFKREVASHFELIDYGRFFRRSKIPVGSYIFSDLERLSPDELERAARAWQVLKASAGDIRLLNHPLRAMRRYELLRTLYEAGINRFNVYRLTECRKPERFPVFIRVENDHGGPETPLLHTQQELDAAIEGLLAAGKGREGRIITEYCSPAPTHKGYYRKYGAFAIAGQVIPVHILFSDSWVVQDMVAPEDPDMVGEIEKYLRDDSHFDQLQQVLSLAHIDFGRIDYTVVNDRVQIFEVNTNPQLPMTDPSPSLHPERIRQNRQSNKKIMNALLAIDSSASTGRTVAFRMAPIPMYWRYRYLPYEVILAFTRVPAMKRFGPQFFRYAIRITNKMYHRVRESLIQKNLINH